ncbi:MAG: hypothetical protein M1816_005240 [Peltula sp. TS41687]|nr:MAG: hypothetical protein M1816_005240 [Peltula sp. TS41687]
MAATRNIVVLGAGVTGLTTALLLSQNPKNRVTIVAKHMPGDFDIEYASPWAGANYMPVSVRGTEAAASDRNTWPELDRLARDVPEAGIHYQETVIYARNRDIKDTTTGKWFAELLSTKPWFHDILPNFSVLPKDELPPGVDSGTRFISVCINVALYLPWLAGQCLKNGATLKRGIAKHILDAADLHASGKKADLVVNCTGLLASRLGGVEDKTVIPARGQIVLVRNEPGKMMTISGTDDGEEEVTYIMQRAAGGGTILGGCYQKGNWESQPDPNLALRIMKRSVELCPQLTNGKGIEALDVIRHGVGLRPLRIDGVRLEKERLQDVWIVHNYGHGGFGYQSSYGCAQTAIRLAEEALSSEGEDIKGLPRDLNVDI